MSDTKSFKKPNNDDKSFLEKVADKITGKKTNKEIPSTSNPAQTLKLIDDKEINNRLENCLKLIIQDVIQPYYFKNELFNNQNIYNYELNVLNFFFVQPAEIILNYLSNPTTTYHKINYKSIEFIVQGGLDENGLFNLGTHKIEPTKSIVVAGFSQNDSYRNSLLYVFSRLINLDQAINTLIAYSKKMVISVEGMHASYNNIKHDTQLTPEELTGILEEQAKSLAKLDNNIAITDKTVELGMLKIDSDSIEKIQKMLYEQLATVLQFPLSKITGQHSTGLNATGETDFRFYYARIEVMQKLLEDFSKAMNLEYVKDASKQVDEKYISICIDTLSNAEMILNKKELEKLKDNLIGKFLI